MASVTADRPPVEGEPTGLKANAIGFVDALVIGLASTAPAYSLAAVMGTLAVARERAHAEGVEAEVELVPERPAAAILGAAARHAARLIVIGAHGESPLRGAILGSTPRLLHLSDRPVLVVPTGKEPRDDG